LKHYDEHWPAEIIVLAREHKKATGDRGSDGGLERGRWVLTGSYPMPQCILTMTYTCPRSVPGLGGNNLPNRGISMSKRIIFIVLLLVCLVTSGCPPVALMSDRMAYGFRGTTHSSLNHEIIAGVRVSASCKKARLDPPLETVSDDHGFFSLHGLFIGELDDVCELSFSHPQFKVKVVNLKIRDSLSEGAAYVWDLDVELDPN
jgi:hypothetical protein